MGLSAQGSNTSQHYQPLLNSDFLEFPKGLSLDHFSFFFILALILLLVFSKLKIFSLVEILEILESLGKGDQKKL